MRLAGFAALGRTTYFSEVGFSDTDKQELFFL